MNAPSTLSALVLNCSLKPSPDESSSDVLAGQLVDELKKYNVESEVVRVADYAVSAGVEVDMGAGDEWPVLRQKMLDADIFIMATPIWVGHMSSVAQRVIERLDAELSETDEAGRLKTYGKVGGVVVVGNEDGAHKVAADIFQALNDVGFSLPAGASTYWNGNAMGKIDYKDLDETPEMVAVATKSMAANVAHLAQLLTHAGYPAPAK